MDAVVQAILSIASKFGTDIAPIGSVVQWAGAAGSPPTNWLLCDGQAVNRTTYANLFALIGTTYGAGDGSTTFNLPNYKGRVPVGLDATQTEFDTLGETGGAKTHTLTVAEMPAHGHQYVKLGTSGGQYGAIDTGNSGSSGTPTTSSTGGGGAHNNLQPYLVQNYIIRAV